MTSRLSLLPLFALSISCATAPISEREQATSSSTSEVPLALRWADSSAEYLALHEQTFRVVLRRVEELAEGREKGTWAVAVDADETLISNTGFQWMMLNREESFDPEIWSQWASREEAPALPGARNFLERVRELGGTVAVVTNRKQSDCEATRRNLESQDLVFDLLLCRDTSRRKEERWASIENGTADPGHGPAEILVWVGDNITDFPELDQDVYDVAPELAQRFGDRWFLLPNPMYGSWTSLPAPTGPRDFSEEH